MSQTTTIPLSTLNKLNKFLDAASREDKTVEMIEATEFGKRTGKNKQAVDYFRRKYPEMVKPKPKSNRYLYNWTLYKKTFLSA